MNKKKDLIIQLKTCPVVQVACQKSGVSRATFYRWRKRDANFRLATDIATQNGCKFINDLAESQLISLIKEKNPTMIMYWLNHRHPAYSNRQLMLSKNDQQLIINAIASNDVKPAYQMLATSVVQGKISSLLFNSFSSIINRLSRSTTDNDVVEKLRLFYNLINHKQRK